MGKIDSYEEVQVESRDELRVWLEENHTRTEGVWLITYKKCVPEKYVEYDAIVEEAICFGWIDSQARGLDDERSMLLFTPRKKGSMWSAVNKRRIERLDAVGAIHEAGWAKIDAAKEDGSWTLLDDVEALIHPADLLEALDENPVAKANYEAFPDSAKKGILWWVKSAKRDTTRAKRIAETVEKAAKNIRAKP